MAIKDFYRGDTVTFNITVSDDAGNPIDLTGATAYFTLKVSTTDTDANAALQKIVTTHTNPTAGETQIILAHTDTNGLTPGTYFYDFQITLASGDVATIDAGQVNVLADVTNA